MLTDSVLLCSLVKMAMAIKAKHSSIKDGIGCLKPNTQEIQLHV